MVDMAIKSIVFLRSTSETQVRGSHLSHNDVFYKDISRVDHIIPALISIQEEDLNKLEPRERPARIFQTNEIILRAYSESTSVHLADKISNVRNFLIQPLMDAPGNEFEISPWIIQSRVLPTLLNQHQIIVNQGIANTDQDFGTRIDLIKHLVHFSDLILDGLKVNAESIHQSERYRHKLMNFEKIRGNLLRAHLSIKDYVGAGSLAEKYLDFEVLVTIGYEHKDNELLENYFTKYESMGFPEYTFEWFVKQQKTAELIDAFSNSQFAPKLAEFTKKYPQIAWHHHAVNDNYLAASDILVELADKEEASADDKKFYLCLGKLAALAGADDREEEEQEAVLNKINNNLNLLDYQNSLPDDIVGNFGMKRETMRALTASDLIDMFTSNEVPADVDNYWKARELIEFMPNDSVKKEKLYVSEDIGFCFTKSCLIL